MTSTLTLQRFPPNLWLILIPILACKENPESWLFPSFPPSLLESQGNPAPRPPTPFPASTANPKEPALLSLCSFQLQPAVPRWGWGGRESSDGGQKGKVQGQSGPPCENIKTTVNSNTVTFQPPLRICPHPHPAWRVAGGAVGWTPQRGILRKFTPAPLIC